MTLSLVQPLGPIVGRHRFHGHVPDCNCAHFVSRITPHGWDCPQGIEQRKRLHYLKGGQR